MRARRVVLETNGRLLAKRSLADSLQSAGVDEFRIYIAGDKAQHNGVTQGDFDLTSKISTYIYSVVRNKWLRDLNKRRVGKISPIEDHVVEEETIDALRNVIHKEEYKIILQCIDRMGATCKRLLLMFYLEEKGMEDIARALNFSNTDVAKAKKWQCKKELEKLVMKHFK